VNEIPNQACPNVSLREASKGERKSDEAVQKQGDEQDVSGRKFV
jgi:hypothetical protein